MSSDPARDELDDYAWWCECYACSHCDGEGCHEGDDGDPAETCRHCEGSGIEPGAPGYEGPEPI
jgi:hypothetical protein